MPPQNQPIRLRQRSSTLPASHVLPLHPLGFVPLHRLHHIHLYCLHAADKTTVITNRTSPILCFCLGIMRAFHPPYTPLLRAIVTWVFENRQGKCYNLVISMTFSALFCQRTIFTSIKFPFSTSTLNFLPQKSVAYNFPFII